MVEQTSISDEAVINRILRGEKGLYGEIIGRYEARLLRYARSFTRDQDDAADVVQNAFVKAYVNLRSFRTNKKFSSWIYRIVHNEAMNALARTRKSVSLEENEWATNIASSEPSLESTMTQTQGAEALHACLAEMPVHYRDVLTLFFLEGRPYRELSDMLRIPIGTVGTRLARAKAMLRKRFPKEYYHLALL